MTEVERLRAEYRPWVVDSLVIATVADLETNVKAAVRYVSV